MFKVCVLVLMSVCVFVYKFCVVLSHANELLIYCLIGNHKDISIKIYIKGKEIRKKTKNPSITPTTPITKKI